MYHLISVLLAQLLCAGVFAGAAQGVPAGAAVSSGAAKPDAARLLFYDDTILNNPDQLQLLQTLVSANTDTIRLDSVESGVTYAKNGVYLLAYSGRVRPESLSEVEKDALLFEETPVWETAFSILAPDQPDDTELARLIAKTAAETELAGGVRVSSRTVLAGVLETVTGRVFKLLSNRETIQPGAWQQAVYTVYHLTYKGRKTAISLISKPVGGIGFWRSEKEKTARQTIPSFVINTGGVEPYEGLVSSAALAEYYSESGTDILAFKAQDVRALAPYLLHGSTLSITPVCGNLDRAAGAYAGWRKYAVLDAGGIKIGVYSLISAPDLNPKTAFEYGLSVSDYASEGRAILGALRDTEHVDLTVFVSQLEQDELSDYLLRTPGNDIVIQAPPRSDTAAGKVSTVDLRGWRRQLNREPILNAWRSPFNMGELEVEFKRERQGFSPARVVELTGDNRPRSIAPDNPYYKLNYNLLETLSPTRSSALLPDPRELWNTLYYPPLAVFNLSANILKERTCAEAAFVKLRNLPARFPGEVTAAQFSQWIPAEKIHIGYITGANLAELAKAVDFSPITPDGTDPDYDEVSKLASSGLAENGRLANIPIDKDEIYKIAFTDDLLKDKAAFPPLASVFGSTQIANADLLGLTVEWLSAARAARAAAADSAFTGFIKGQRAAGNPPAASAVRENPEQTLYRAGRLGELYSLFRETALREYYGRLLAFTAHRDDIRPFVRLNLRKLELLFSQTDISNATLYGDFSNTKLTADSQMLVQGALDFYVEYFKDNLRWDNGVSMTYGKTTIYPTAGGSVTSESSDDVLIQSELVQKRYRVDNLLGGFLAGPFLSLG
ncbi:MAG: hypothetical protein PHW69_09805, partial [Elusimicrobiaceae bacterium]|nr:hypothetical protein [Elusimicrobiaceae bacterium]